MNLTASASETSMEDLFESYPGFEAMSRIDERVVHAVKITPTIFETIKYHTGEVYTDTFGSNFVVIFQRRTGLRYLIQVNDWVFLDEGKYRAKNEEDFSKFFLVLTAL